MVALDGLNGPLNTVLRWCFGVAANVVLNGHELVRRPATQLSEMDKELL